MADGSETKLEPAPSDSDGDNALAHWRERLLTGVIVTSVAALLPPLLIQSWQWFEGVPGAQPGLSLAVTAMVALTSLGLWRTHYQLRARLLLTLGFALTAIAILTEGLAPAQFAAICTLTTLGVLLFSARSAYLILAASGACIALAAFLFSHGYVAPLPSAQLDARDSLNWLRVGLYTLLPSATAAVATNYLLTKLRETLRMQQQLVVQLRDEVVQRERTLADLARAQARLLHAQKLEAIGQLAAGIAHDFNNTLSVVALEAELLKRKNLASGDLARGAEALLGAASRGRQLTRQLTLFSRAETTVRPVIEVAPTFSECARALHRLLPSEITFEMEIGPGTLHVCILPSELQQIVLNLGINARDAMPDGGRLTVSLTRVELTPDSAAQLDLIAGSYALLSCRDTGSGMDDPTLARVFEPFYTTKGPGRGTGLGLTNVWNIARRVLGSVQAESALGSGTTLRVYLPLTAAGPAIREEELPLTAPSGQETVLVVEDDIRVRALLVTVLTDAGYLVLEAANTDAALALDSAHAGTIELLCTDVVMPGRPARELIAQLRERRPKISVLVCSGYSEDEQIARGIRAGEWQQLDKPFTGRTLLAAVRNTIDQR